MNEQKLTKINYKQNEINPNRWTTDEFYNLFSLYEGHVTYCEITETWTGKLRDLVNKTKSETRYDFPTKYAATRWVNKMLRNRGA